MTQQVITQSLYDNDFLLWTEDTANKLRVRDFDHLDIDNLIEEVESLGRSERRELESRLYVLLEHILKRCYVPMPNDFNGWERTIREQRRQIKSVLKNSPSLTPYLSEVFDDAFTNALEEVRSESGYKLVLFPNDWQFSRDAESLLNVTFWGSGNNGSN